MSAVDPKEAADRRTDEAFARSRWADPRGEYRVILRQLRERDEAAFEDAVREYEAAVSARLSDASVDPVPAWLAYGQRLAGRIGGGRTVGIDESGRASDVDDLPAEPTLLLHLPAAEGARAIVVARPREPSAAQRATLAVLAEGRTAAL
ncbi:MAG TPA: hypothetical protein VMN78_02595 [Longimicrobiales bacterium]|nr:hypothetical protein [Longimicrobiales bacterium]